MNQSKMYSLFITYDDDDENDGVRNWKIMRKVYLKYKWKYLAIFPEMGSDNSIQ